MTDNMKETLKETIEFLTRVRPLCKQEDYRGNLKGEKGPLESECSYLLERLDTLIND